jgi:Zn-dependent peptidase ImmA (M78 family)
MFQRGFKSWCETISAQYRKELKVGGSDPIDSFTLASLLGITVWPVDKIPNLDSKTLTVLTVEDKSSWSAATISLNDEHLIVINPTHSKARTASNLMHEISHIIIGHEPARVDVSEDNILLLNTYDKTQEDEADWLCGCLLLPRTALLKIKKMNVSSTEAAGNYGVSVDMLQYRMNVTGVNRQFKSHG